MEELCDSAERNSMLRGPQIKLTCAGGTPEKLRIPPEVGRAGRDEKGEQGESSAPRFPA